MLNTEMIERLIELSLVSGYIKDGNAPLSLILIGNPETAKTSMIMKFNAPHTILTADLSAKPIVDFIIPKLKRKELHHIVVPDMVKILSHRETTVNATITFLNALMEEGIKQNLFFGQVFEFDKPMKCGLITAVTTDFYYKMFRRWQEIGFTTRFLPVSFRYSHDTVLKIHESIQNNIIFDEVRKLKKIKSKKVKIPKDIGSWINIKAYEIAKKESKEKIVVTVQSGKQARIKIEIHGFRLHKQLRKLAQSIALCDRKTEVTWNHITELQSLMDYIRLPKNPKVI